MKKAEKAIWVGRILLVAFGLMLARPPLVRGALNAFIKIEGIEGESRDDGHELSCRFHVLIKSALGDSRRLTGLAARS